MTDCTLKITRVFSAPQDLVWKALTGTEALNRWFFPLDEFRPEPGFAFEFTVEHEGNVYRHICTVTEVVPQRRLPFTWRYDRYEGDSLVMFGLSSEGEGTQVTLTRSGLETFPKLPDFSRESFQEGWTGTFEKLDAHLAGRS
jgi:uncharacterized protein YndB with AHSA1/START domain